jgi:hypothetical protein
MKKYLGFLVLLLLLVSPVTASIGIGIKWTTESEFINENQERCITYGIYNPFDTDVMGYLTATQELAGLYQAEEPKLIPAHTSSGEAIPTNICFTVSEVYEEKSYLGFLPKRQCSEEQVTLKGEIMAAYVLESGPGMGSVTGVSFASPLRLRVTCTPLERNWTPVYAIIILIVAIAGFAFRKRRRPS